MVKRRCVFLDRDGVINVKLPDERYVSCWEEFEFLPGIIDWVRLFNALGYLVVVVTNQRGVARGLVRAEDLEKIHVNMIQQFAEAGGRIDDVFVCPHEQGTCDCRKPLPGLVLAAQERWHIELSASLLIGDSQSDRQLAQNCGLTFVAVEGGRIREVFPAP